MSGRGKGGKGLGARAARVAKNGAQLAEEARQTAWDEAWEMAEEMALVHGEEGGDEAGIRKYLDFDYEEDRPVTDLLKKVFDDEDRPLSDLVTKDKKRKKKRPKIPIYDSEDEPVTKLYKKTVKAVKAFPVPDPEIHFPPPMPVVTQQPPLTTVIPEAVLPLTGASGYKTFQGTDWRNAPPRSEAHRNGWAAQSGI